MKQELIVSDIHIQFCDTSIHRRIKMQGISSRRYGERPILPAKPSAAAGNKSCVTSPKARSIVHSTSLLNHSGPFQCSRRRYAVSGERLRKGHADKVILRRALSPPARRSSLRWLNFRPTPSRLSNMSVA